MLEVAEDDWPPVGFADCDGEHPIATASSSHGNQRLELDGLIGFSPKSEGNRM
jgi:hypothetical protein